MTRPSGQSKWSICKWALISLLALSGAAGSPELLRDPEGPWTWSLKTQLSVGKHVPPRMIFVLFEQALQYRH